MVVRHMTPCPDALRGAAPMRPYRGCHGRVVRKVGKYADEARLGLWGGLQVCDHSDARMVVRGERERERETGDGTVGRPFSAPGRPCKGSYRWCVRRTGL